jgi:arylamine N-acetyltransferase
VNPDDELLACIGARGGELTATSLAELQRAWCFTQPFHNLDVLAGAGSGAPPLDRRQAVERCVAKLGGPCHVQSWGFLSLLRRVGFDARLCGATVSRPDDHLLVHVSLADGAYLCDVGNGQPYLQPFPLHRDLEQRHLGWVVRSGCDAEGLVLQRRSPDHPSWRRVYRAGAEPRQWEDFAGNIERHHREQSYGPFLSGLRVVRIGATSMVAVRDDQVTVYREGGFESRRLSDTALIRLLKQDLGLGALPVEAAVAAWRAAERSRP